MRELPEARKLKEQKLHSEGRAVSFLCRHMAVSLDSRIVKKQRNVGISETLLDQIGNCNTNKIGETLHDSNICRIRRSQIARLLLRHDIVNIIVGSRKTDRFDGRRGGHI